MAIDLKFGRILVYIGSIFKMHHFISESSPSFVTSASTSPSTTPIGGSVVGSSSALTKPVPRPLGSSPLFSGPNSPLQSLLYRHPYLSGNFSPNLFCIFIKKNKSTILDFDRVCIQLDLPL